MYIVASIAIVCLAGLLGYVIYLWQKDRGKESKRLYRFVDDLLDRVGAEHLHDYAMSQRIKMERVGQMVDVPPTTNKEIAKDAENAQQPPAFVRKTR